MDLTYEKSFKIPNFLEETKVTFFLDCVPSPDGRWFSMSTLLKMIVSKDNKEEKYYLCLPSILPYTFSSLVSDITYQDDRPLNGEKLLKNIIEDILKDSLNTEDIEKFSKTLIENYYKHLFDYILDINYISDEEDLFENHKEMFALTLEEALDL